MTESNKTNKTNKTETTEPTKSELLKIVAELEKKLVEEKSKSQNMKDRVLNLIEAGVNSIDQIAEKLNITNKNVSSVLTAIRKDLAVQDRIIITQKYKGETKLAVLVISDLGW